MALSQMRKTLGMLTLLLFVAAIPGSYTACSGGFHGGDLGLESGGAGSEDDGSSEQDDADSGSHMPPVDDTELALIASQMDPGTWAELPGTNKITDVFPESDGHPAWGVIGPRAVVGAWSGGVVAEGRLYIWGGGHADYGGNEVYAYDLGNFTWSRLTEPSPYSICDNSMICMTADGTPTSVHSYDGIEYLPNVGQIWMGPGSGYLIGHGADQHFFFDIKTNTWEERTKLGPSLPRSAYDPVTGYLLVADASRLVVYDPVTDQIVNRTPSGWSGYGTNTGAFDHHRRIFLDMGTNQAYIYDLSGTDLTDPNASLLGNRKQVTYKQDNGSLVEFYPKSAAAMGIEYDPTRELFIAWDGGPSVWTLDPETWVWTEYKNELQMAPSAYNSSGQKLTWGVFGRWRYLETYDVYLGYNNINGHVWLYRMPQISN